MEATTPERAAATGAPPNRRRARRVRRRSGRTAERAGLVLLGLALGVPAVWFGGQHTALMIAGAVLAAASAVLLGQGLARVPRLAWLVLGLTAFTLFQLVPLPFALVRVLSPNSAEAWSGALAPFGEAAPGFITLSVDPSGTALEVLKGSAYACLVVAVFGAAAAWGTASVAMLLFASALLVALITFAHGALDIQKIFGLYAPPNLSDRWTRGPFVNGNNLAGYLNLGALAGCGLWAAGRGGALRFVPAFGVPLLVTLVLLSGSRGGVIALVVSGLIFGASMVKFWGARPVVAAGAVLLVGGIGAVTFAALADARHVQALADQALSGKILGWRWSLAMIQDFPIFGVGRGAFETAFHPYRGSFPHDWSPVFAHAENIVVDWVSEWGVPVVLGLIGVVVASMPQIVRRMRRDPHLAGLWLGAFALILQGLSDFGVELFAIGAAFVTAIAAGSASSVKPEGGAGWRRFVPVAAVGAGLVIVVGLGANPVALDREAIARAAVAVEPKDAARVAELRAELHRLTLRHPGEPYFPLIGATLAARTHGDRMPWLARSLARGPRYGGVHLGLADALYAKKRRSQALMHVRLAARYDSSLEGDAFRRALAWSRSVAELAAAFPEGSEGGALFRELCERVPHRARVECFREALRREPTRESLASELVDALVTALDGAAAPCAGVAAADCRAEADRVLAAASALAGWRVAYYRGRLRATSGDFKGAAEALLASCPVSDEGAACLERAEDYASRSNDNGLFGRAAERRLVLLCATHEHCAEAHARVGEAMAGRGAWGLALHHHLKAAEADPTTARFLALAEVALNAGVPASARNALVRAKRASAGSPADAERVRELERRLLDGSSL